MIQINKPVKCPKCGQLIETYSINQNTNKIVFACPNDSTVLELTEQEYRQKRVTSV